MRGWDQMYGEYLYVCRDGKILKGLSLIGINENFCLRQSSAISKNTYNTYNYIFGMRVRPLHNSLDATSAAEV